MESSRMGFEHRIVLVIGPFVCKDKIWISKSNPLNLKVNIFLASVISILPFGILNNKPPNQQSRKSNNAFDNQCYITFLDVKRSKGNIILH